MSESEVSKEIVEQDRAGLRDRFTELSRGIAEVLASLDRAVADSVRELDAAHAAVALKTQELRKLHDIEVEADTLERLVAEQLRHKEAFAAEMERERLSFEEEKAQREREKEEYAEKLRSERERERMEYESLWAAEKGHARQQFEEESLLATQKIRLKQEAMERDYMQRELVLKEKELEWVQLIQELEQFMAKLAKRAQASAASASFSQVLDHYVPAGGASETPDGASGDEAKASASELKEILASQERRIENITDLP